MKAQGPALPPALWGPAEVAMTWEQAPGHGAAFRAYPSLMAREKSGFSAPLALHRSTLDLSQGLLPTFLSCSHGWEKAKCWRFPLYALLLQ